MLYTKHIAASELEQIVAKFDVVLKEVLFLRRQKGKKLPAAVGRAGFAGEVFNTQ